MPDTPIVDTHLHIWDPRLIRYPWIEGNPVLDRPYLPEDHARAFSGVEIEAMIFLQCDAEVSSFLKEAEWVAGLAEPRIRGMVAFAPLEKGKAVERDIEELTRHKILRGVRRILQGEEPEFCLRPDFVEGLRTLANFGLSFDICVNFRHMGAILKLVEAVPEVPMILDHIGKPSIRDGRIEPWASQMRELAKFPNVTCKVSGVANEAAPGWSEDDLKPFIDVAFSAFGFERTIYGGDWPVMLEAIEPMRWIRLLDDVLEGVSAEEKKKFWCDNAFRVYRL